MNFLSLWILCENGILDILVIKYHITILHDLEFMMKGKSIKIKVDFISGYQQTNLN